MVFPTLSLASALGLLGLLAPPAFLLQNEFWDAFGLVVLIIVFLMLYRLVYPEMVASPLVALVIVAIITFLVVIPFPWFKYLLFVVLFMYALFWTFKPYKW